jgi:hypothetical protein
MKRPRKNRSAEPHRARESEQRFRVSEYGRNVPLSLGGTNASIAVLVLAGEVQDPSTEPFMVKVAWTARDEGSRAVQQAGYSIAKVASVS